MFRRDTTPEADFRMVVRTWLEANLPGALRNRTTRPLHRIDSLVSRARGRAGSRRTGPKNMAEWARR